VAYLEMTWKVQGPTLVCDVKHVQVSIYLAYSNCFCSSSRGP